MEKCKGFNKDIALDDIYYCLDNVNKVRGYDYGGDNYNFFFRNPHFYLNSSDNIKEAMKRKIKDGDSVLTVCGGGDYLLEAIYNGARKVVTFDVNDIQYYVLCLKLWAIEELDYKEYIDLFVNFNNNHMSSLLINKVISKHRDDPAYEFWHYFMIERSYEEGLMYRLKRSFLVKLSYGLMRNLIPDNELDHIWAYEVSSYLKHYDFRATKLMICARADSSSLSFLENEECFNRLKSKIDDVDISFINANVLDLKNVLDGKFDSIFLSNISAYLSRSSNIRMVNDLLSLLNKDGTLNMYHQGMNISWFYSAVNNSNFKLSRKNFYSFYQTYKESVVGVDNTLMFYRDYVSKGGSISLRDIPTYGGAPESKCDTDVLSLIKKH